jgi:hypothetical protein
MSKEVMMNGTDNTAIAVQPSYELDLHCPYTGASDVCNAALSSLLPSPSMKANFCNSENYDNCPIFLAKALRRRRR